MACSFPPATVKWERGNDELTRVVYENVSGDDPDCSHTFTITGKIEFDNVRYSDAAVYKCRAVNEYSMRGPPYLDLRLRVHSKSLSKLMLSLILLNVSGKNNMECSILGLERTMCHDISGAR